MPSIKVARTISVAPAVHPTPSSPLASAPSLSHASSVRIGFIRKMQAGSVSQAARILPH